MDEETKSAIKQLETDRNHLLGRVLATEAALGAVFASWGSNLPELATKLENDLSRMEKELRTAGITPDSLQSYQDSGRSLRGLLTKLGQPL